MFLNWKVEIMFSPMKKQTKQLLLNTKLAKILLIQLYDYEVIQYINKLIDELDIVFYNDLLDKGVKEKNL